jgi:hypothetical protein
MDCARLNDVDRLLDGLLDAASTRACLGHLRGCGPCRTALDRGRATRREAAALGGEGDDDDPQPAVRRRGVFAALMALPKDPRTARRRRLGALFGASVLIAAIYYRATAADADVDATAELRLALLRGRAQVVAPVGAQDGRPRVAAAVAASPVASARLLIFGPDGATLFARTVTPGEDGVQLLPHRLDVRGEPTLDAWRLVAPFPSESELPLATGGGYGVAFALPGGGVAAGAPFVLR